MGLEGGPDGKFCGWMTQGGPALDFGGLLLVALSPAPSMPGRVRAALPRLRALPRHLVMASAGCWLQRSHFSVPFQGVGGSVVQGDGGEKQVGSKGQEDPWSGAAPWSRDAGCVLSVKRLCQEPSAGRQIGLCHRAHGRKVAVP